MRAVDTNVLVRLIARDDPGQVSAAEDIVTNGAWVSHLVLLETVWVLGTVYELDPARVATAVEMLLNHKNLTVEDPDVVAAALVRHRRRTVVSFSDCLILETARKAGHLPLGTFDRDLGKLEGTQIVI